MVQNPPLPSALSQTLFAVGDLNISVGEAALGFAALIVALLIAIVVIAARGSRQRLATSEAQAQRAGELERRLSEMLQSQAEASGNASMASKAASRGLD